MSEETQVTQETSISDATPAQDTTSTETTTSQPATKTESEKTTSTEQENWEYTGDRNSVPDSMKKYVAALDRYVSKKDQSRIELEKKVKEYETKLASFKEPTKTDDIGVRPPEGPQVTQEEAEAIMLGDAKTLQKVIQREAQRTLEANLSPKEAAINQKLSAMEFKQREIDAAEMISGFAEINPDFWELYSTYEDYCITAARNGKSLEDIYKGVKAFEEKATQRLEAKRKTDLEKKKNGTVVGKSITGTSDIIYADNEAQAKRLAIELTLKGDKRHVRIKPKK